MLHLPEAVERLRVKRGLNQSSFGKLLNISAKTVLRYEGGQQPSRKVLLALARIATDSGMHDLAEEFTAAWQGKVAELTSARRSIPRIPKKELRLWSDTQDQVKQSLHLLAKGLRNGVTMNDDAATLIECLAGMLTTVQFQMQCYLTPPWALGLSAVVLKDIANRDSNSEAEEARTAAARTNKKTRKRGATDKK